MAMVSNGFINLEHNASFYDIQADDHHWILDATYCFGILVRHSLLANDDICHILPCSSGSFSPILQQMRGFLLP